jgi:hypothetical protein
MPRAQVLQLGGGLAAAHAQGGHPQHARGLPQLLQQRQPIPIRPLQILHRQQHRGLLGQPRQQLAQGEEGTHAHAQQVLTAWCALGACPQAWHPPQRGEEPHQGARARGPQPLYRCLSQGGEPARQALHQPIHPLVGHALALMAAALEHQGLGVLAPHLREEVAHQACLSHAGLALHPHRHSGALAAVRQRRVQRRQLLPPADEGQLHSGRSGHGQGWLHAEPPQHLLTGRALGGIAAQQLHAQLAQVLRQPGHARLRGRRLYAALGVQHLVQVPGKGALPGEALVEQRAHAVPVRRGRGRCPLHLLGSDVGRGAHHRTAPHAALAHVRQHAKVQQHHPPGLGNQQVGGFYVPVHLAGTVQGMQAASELGLGGAQPALVEARGRGYGLGRKRGHPPRRGHRLHVPGAGEALGEELGGCLSRLGREGVAGGHVHRLHGPRGLGGGGLGGLPHVLDQRPYHREAPTFEYGARPGVLLQHGAQCSPIRSCGESQILSLATHLRVKLAIAAWLNVRAGDRQPPGHQVPWGRVAGGERPSHCRWCPSWCQPPPTWR